MSEPQLVRLEVRFGFGRDLILASKNALDSRLREGAAIEGALQRRYLRAASFLTMSYVGVVKTAAIRKFARCNARPFLAQLATSTFGNLFIWGLWKRTIIGGASRESDLRIARFFDHFGADRGQNCGYSHQRPGACVCQAPRTDVPLVPPLHNLEQEEFEVVGFGHAPYDGMVGRLLAFLDLAQLNAGIVCRAHEHFAEAVGIHEVRAAASG